MEETRPQKRVRQACEPCRRKKSRCPGERPVCSFCQRLGQQCVYNDSEGEGTASRQAQKMEQRMGALEGKLDHLLEQILPLATSSSGELRCQARDLTPRSTEFQAVPWPPNNAPSAAQASPRQRINDQQQHGWSGGTHLSQTNAHELLLDDAGLRSAGHAYLTWCHAQPLMLFREDTFLESLGSRDHGLLLAVQALALRFPPRTLQPHRRQRLSEMAQASRRLAMEAVVNSEVELSTVQTLCLLSIIDFADGNPIVAETTINVAASVIRGVLPGRVLGDPQEFSDCVRSISLVKNLQGCVKANTRDFNFSSLTMLYDAPSACDQLPPSQLDKGILKYTYRLSEAWHMARVYAASEVASDAAPPWNRQSDYSAVMQRHLDIDSHVPLKYRFYANRLSNKSPETLHEQRRYWGPYFFMQIIYAAIPCLLNHPFLLSMRLRNFRHTMPQAFIHQSFDLITRHAGWIMYFIDIVDKKALQLSDPALAHCAVIVATIHLQHSFVQDQKLREKSQAGFDKCVRFLSNMGSIWSNVSIMAEKLRKLQNSVVMVPPRASTSEESSNFAPRQSLSIDSELLWDLLIYESAGRDDESPRHSIFASSLVQLPTIRRDDAKSDEYDLVGSAGISGHKTVPKESPVYAPEEVAGHLDGAPMAPWAAENGFMSGIDEESNYEALLLQPNDFGWAIDDWMSFH